MTKGDDILFGELFGRPKVLPVRFFAEISEEPREVVGQVSSDCGTEPFAKQFLGNHRHYFKCRILFDVIDKRSLF